ncbi:hypothetical protein C8R43DRAFT_529370 [Mycena crocata]|nr:hypothetical protein C8R43DRAFT_529370 [Mycena crocata]
MAHARGSPQTRRHNLFLYPNKIPAFIQWSAAHGVGSADLGCEVNSCVGKFSVGFPGIGPPEILGPPEMYKYRSTHPPIFHSNHHPLFTHSLPLTTVTLYLDMLDADGAFACHWRRWCRASSPPSTPRHLTRRRRYCCPRRRLSLKILIMGPIHYKVLVIACGGSRIREEPIFRPHEELGLE